MRTVWHNPKSMNRRAFLGSMAVVPAAGLLPGWQSNAAQRPLQIVRPKRLRAGDTVGIVAPASATFQSVDVTVARESLEALGLKVKIGEHVLSRHGYLAGTDKDRAADINRFFKDDSIRAVLPIRGGWGSSRVLPHLDFDEIRRNPKIVLGYSDITALHLAIHAKTGLVTFHGPERHGPLGHLVGRVRQTRAVQRRSGDLREPEGARRISNSLTQTENRVQTITPGTAQRTADRRQPHGDDDDPRLALRAVHRRCDPLSRGRWRGPLPDRPDVHAAEARRDSAIGSAASSSGPVPSADRAKASPR